MLWIMVVSTRFLIVNLGFDDNEHTNDINDMLPS